MYPDELGDVIINTIPSSGSRDSGVQPEAAAGEQEAQPQRPIVMQGPPQVPPSADSPIVPSRRRLTRKQVDPVADAALKRIHEKLSNEHDLYKLRLKHYHMN